MGYNLGTATDETTADREANEREERYSDVPVGYAQFPAKPIPSDADVLAATKILIAAAHGRAWNAGWYHDPKTGAEVPRNLGEIFALIHSEISEALEGHRKDLMDDKLPHRKMVPVELFDAIIRCLDTIGMYYPDDAAALLEKMKYNDNRADHKPANRVKSDGKKF